MKPISEIRRENLERLVTEEAPSKVAAAARIGKDVTQIHQWLSEPGAAGARNISSASARVVERAFDKPAGWLDHPSDEASQPTRTDPERMADAMRLLEHLGELQGVPELVRDPVALCIAYDFLEYMDEAEGNVLDMTKRLAAKLREG
jgi:hypothetical protein